MRKNLVRNVGINFSAAIKRHSGCASPVCITACFRSPIFFRSNMLLKLLFTGIFLRYVIRIRTLRIAYLYEVLVHKALFMFWHHCHTLCIRGVQERGYGGVRLIAGLKFPAAIQKSERYAPRRQNRDVPLCLPASFYLPPFCR